MPIDGDEETKLALGENLRNIDMDVADRIGVEHLLLAPVAIHVGKLGRCRAVAGSGEGTSGSAQGSWPEERREAIVERQQRVPAKGCDDGFLLKRKNNGPR